MKIDLSPDIAFAKKAIFGVSRFAGFLIIGAVVLLPIVLLIENPDALVGLSIGAFAVYIVYVVNVGSARVLKDRKAARELKKQQVYDSLNYWIKEPDGSLKAIGQPRRPCPENTI